jgi:DNA replicative helicase MCM subunit Mcm2 (Cdc46/Mcm family)
VSSTEEGVIDTDIITTGYGQSQRDRIWTILEIIKDIQGTDGASRDDITRIAEERGVPVAKVNDDLDRLKREGRIYEKFEDRYRLA